MATSRVEARLLADRLITSDSRLAAVGRIAAANLLMVLCAWIAIPLPWTPVPITGQTFGVLLIALLLGSRRGTAVMLLYLAEGAAGLPVFAPLGAPGSARLLGPTAGYLLAYPIAAFVAGWMTERRSLGTSRNTLRSTAALGAAILSGEAIIFAMGCAWLSWMMRLTVRGTLTAGLTPFLPGEIIKTALLFAAVRGVEIASAKH